MTDGAERGGSSMPRGAGDLPRDRGDLPRGDRRGAAALEYVAVAALVAGLVLTGLAQTFDLGRARASFARGAVEASFPP